MMQTRTVGPVIFENAEGLPVATATYTAHVRLRAPQLKFRGEVYYQNRQEGATWVYRLVPHSAVPGPDESDPQLEAIGPPVAIPAPVVVDVVADLKARIAELEAELAAMKELVGG